MFMNAQLQQWIQFFQEGVADTNQPQKKKILDFDLSYCVPKTLHMIEEICEQQSVRVITPQILTMPQNRRNLNLSMILSVMASTRDIMPTLKH